MLSKIPLLRALMPSKLLAAPAQSGPMRPGGVIILHLLPQQASYADEIP
jgi:hypothetical protein